MGVNTFARSKELAPLREEAKRLNSENPNMSVSQIAAKLGLAKTTVYQWGIRGRKRVPRRPVSELLSGQPEIPDARSFAMAILEGFAATWAKVEGLEHRLEVLTRSLKQAEQRLEQAEHRGAGDGEFREKAEELRAKLHSCTHHWSLGSPHEGIVHGKCQLCGVEKDFPAGIPSRRE